jgi:hypothetical protein
MSKPKLPSDFVKLCRAVSAKRPKTVIDHILKHGFISTQELKDTYGYNHPPRAVRDVKEHGNYAHIAMRPIRRADIMWTGLEVEIYDRLKKQTQELQKNIPGYVKEIVEAHLKNVQ